MSIQRTVMHIGQMISALLFWGKDTSDKRFSNLYCALEYNPVAISEDGNTAAIIDLGVSTIFMFSREGDNWLNTTSIPSRSIGRSIALDRTGTKMIVSDWRASSFGVANAGRAVLHEKKPKIGIGGGMDWSPTVIFQRVPMQPDSGYGRAVDISSNGRTLVISEVPTDHTKPSKVYVFDFIEGTTWRLSNEITLTNTRGYQELGYRIKVNGDGTAIQVGHLDGPTGGCVNSHFYSRFSANPESKSPFFESIVG